MAHDDPMVAAGMAGLKDILGKVARLGTESADPVCDACGVSYNFVKIREWN